MCDPFHFAVVAVPPPLVSEVDFDLGPLKLYRCGWCKGTGCYFRCDGCYGVLKWGGKDYVVGPGGAGWSGPYRAAPTTATLCEDARALIAGLASMQALWERVKARRATPSGAPKEKR